jgi:hypothetical protein
VIRYEHLDVANRMSTRPVIVMTESPKGTEPELIVDVMMTVAGRISGEPLSEEARPVVVAMAEEEKRVVLRCRPLLDLCPAPPALASQRPRGGDHTLGVGHRPVGRVRSRVDCQRMSRIDTHHHVVRRSTRHAP